MKIVKSILVGVLVLTSFEVIAQSSEFDITHFTVEDGLPENGAEDMLQDRLGFLWFATLNGLTRYDGVRAVNFLYESDNAASLSNNKLRKIFEDSEGNIWIGARLGITQYIYETGQFVRHVKNGDYDGIPASAYIDAIIEDVENGIIWIGSGEGLFGYDLETNDFSAQIGTPEVWQTLRSLIIKSMHLDSKGRFWIGTYKEGLFVLGSDRTSLTSVTEILPPQASITDIIEDRNGFIWVGTEENGAFQLQESNSDQSFEVPVETKSHLLARQDVSAIYEDRFGDIWLGTDQNGIAVYHPDEDSLTYLYSSSQEEEISIRITSFMEDEAGTLYIGTEYQGIIQVQHKDNGFTHWEKDSGSSIVLSHDHVMAVVEDDKGVFWVANRNGALNRIDPFKEEYTYFNLPTSKEESVEILCMALVDTGHLWIGTERNGIYVFNPQNRTLSQLEANENAQAGLSDNRIYTIHQHSDGTIWIGTRVGIDVFNPQSSRFTSLVHDPDDPSSLVEGRVRTIYEDRQGVIWVGTDGGVGRYDRVSQTFMNYTHDAQVPSSLSYNEVRALYEDHQGVLWVGTRSGLNSFDRESEEFTRFLINEESVPSPVVYGIMEDESGSLWLSTSTNLIKFNPELSTFRMYSSTEDGLINNQFTVGAYWAGSDGRFYFGGVHGVDIITPLQVHDNTFVPPMRLTGISIFGQPTQGARNISLVDTLHLDHTQHSFTIEFAALDFTNPAQNQYMYKLENVDEDWVYAGNRNFASYTSIEPGSYTFLAKGSNNDGVWSEQPLSIHIQMPAPYWQTRWFSWSLVLTGVGLIVGLYRYRTRIIRLSNQKLSEANALLNAEIEARKSIEVHLREAKLAAEKATNIKSEFLATMSHEIRTPMNGVIGMTNLLSETPLSEEQLELVDIIRTSSDSLLTIINDILDYSKIEAGRIELAPHPCDLHVLLNNVLDINIIDTHKRLELISYVDPAMPGKFELDSTRMRQILVNLLSNAIKFTEEGEVVVSMQSRLVGDGLHEIHVSVCDTGIGISPGQMDRLFTAFSQVDPSTTRKYGGSGLGLSISKRLCELMGGRIWVESEIGKGSTFHYTVKASVVPEPMEEWQREKPSHITGQRLLVVGENTSLQRVLKRYLEFWGVLVKTVRNAEEAIKCAEREAFNMAIVDLCMADAKGLHTAKEIKKCNQDSSFLVILLHSVAESEDFYDLKDMPVLKKPVKPAKLYRVLDGAFRHENTPIESHAGVNTDTQELTTMDIPPRIEASPRILVAEDNVINQKVILRVLERLGHHADIATNGQEVLDMLEDTPYDIIFMDLQMPVMSGVETTKRIRSSSKRDVHPFIVALTANTLLNVREECLQAGVNEYISKPFRMSDLSGVLQQYQESIRVQSEAD